MTSTSIYPHEPFFYIIQHVSTGMKYGGCKWSRPDPNSFMTQNGYQTSSLKVKKLIEQDGVEGFKTLLIMTQTECGMPVYDYESTFLQANDIASREDWMNGHNNDGIIAFGSEEYKQMLMAKHGVTHNLDIAGVREKRDATWMVKYGGHPMKSPDVQMKAQATINERYGGHQMRNQKCKDKSKKTTLARYGVEHTVQTEEFKQKSRQTSIDNYGVDNFSKTPERREQFSKIHKNSTVWNDGEKNYKLRDGEVPEPHWVRGSLPYKKRTASDVAATVERQTGSKLWNDGTKNYQVRKGDLPEPHWVLGKIKKANQITYGIDPS